MDKLRGQNELFKEDDDDPDKTLVDGTSANCKFGRNMRKLEMTNLEHRVAKLFLPIGLAKSAAASALWMAPCARQDSPVNCFFMSAKTRIKW